MPTPYERFERAIRSGRQDASDSVNGLRVLHGPEDFGRMQAGEVLVAEITTPEWTPLFALAAAVVTDLGGPLSHGSIVAREYGIPAVLGTGTAPKRVKDGDLLVVDGDSRSVRREEAP